MSAMDNRTAEQLWYTWSDVGLSTVHAGFRVRAASPGLTQIYSDRVQSMDRYMRYVLPPGTDPFAITPDMAPVCLAFIRTNWNNEYILVHKNYTGKDGVGRHGNFFVHVIALGELSQSFSAEDAIWLWDSAIWKTNDQELDRRSNSLEPIPLTKLQSQTDNFQPNMAQVREYLRFLIEAYLSRNDRRYSLYIAAPTQNSAMIAYLIAGLVNCLPRQLRAGLTFSTYEPDVTKATTEIVGTSWIATPGKEAEAAQIFSPQFYREKLAINCSTLEYSSLQGHPQATYKPLAADFADYATDCMLSDNREQLDALLDLAEKTQALDVDTFLRMYYNEIANTDSIVEDDIDRYLADPSLCLDRLSSRNFRKRIIDRAGENRQWSENGLQPRLRTLCEQAKKEYAQAGHRYSINNTGSGFSTEYMQTTDTSFRGSPTRSRSRTTAQTKKVQITLADALFLLAKRAIDDIVGAMKKKNADRETLPGEGGEDDINRRKKFDTVVSLLFVMDCCLLPQNAPEIWQELFEKTTQNSNTKAFLTMQLSIFGWLLQKWDDVFPIHPSYDETLRPLLIIPWSRLGKFLQLDVQRHKQWNVFAVEKLATDTTLTPEVAQELEQNYSGEITSLLAQLLQEPDLTIAASFSIRLLEKGYSVKPQFAVHIEKLLAQMVNNPQLWSDAKELIVTLTRNGYTGTESYLSLVETLLSHLFTSGQAPMQAMGNELIDILVEYRYPGKKRLVDILLASPVYAMSFESVLERVYRTSIERSTFFINDGSQYLSAPEHIKAMRSVYQKLLSELPRTQKLERLFVLLDAFHDENTVLYLLNITSLEVSEYAPILERYGKDYLKAFTYARQLANKVVEWFNQLIKSGYPERLKLLFALFTSGTDHKLLENLLSSAQLSIEESHTFFRKYGLLPRYFLFFYGSATTPALFSQLAQQANALAERGQTDLAAEKMSLLLAWLQPSEVPLKSKTFERILHAASLRPDEQISFMEHHGKACLQLYPQLALLKEYTDTYVKNFNADSLERPETRNFFAFLTQNYQRLFLDTDIQIRLQWWKTIDSYFISPNATQPILTDLGQALYSLGLPNNARFRLKLAKAFVSCVRTYDDLDTIVAFMQRVSKLQNDIFQLLYIMAEQVAEVFRQQQDLRLLLPYLEFVPNVLDITQQQRRYFVREFFDTLLYSINVLNLNQWKALDTFLAQQGLSKDAQAQWKDYLKWLDLLDKLNTVEGAENGTSVQEAQLQSSPPPVDGSKPPSRLKRFINGWRDNRRAKKELDRALKSREVARIAEAWVRYEPVILMSSSNRIKQGRQAQIKASYEFEQYCYEAMHSQNISLSLASQIVKMNETIEALGLQPSQEQKVCINQAKLILAPGTKQPYQNPGRSPSDSLPAYNNLSSVAQAPNPSTRTQGEYNTNNPKRYGQYPLQEPKALELRVRSTPNTEHRQQSQPLQNGTRFDIEEGSKSKKKRNPIKALIQRIKAYIGGS